MKNRTIVIRLLALALCVCLLAACGKKKEPEETTAAPTETAAWSETAAPAPETPSSMENTTAAPVEALPTEAPQTTAAPATEAPTAAPVTQPPATEATTAAPAQPDVSAYTKEQVLSLLTDAVNKTKGYTGNITVSHKESFDFSVTNVEPRLPLVQQAIDFVTGLVIKPSEEMYSFSGGHARTSEGEDTQLLLPKAAAFSLPASGVAAASAARENGMIHVLLTLAPEECTALDQIPPYHAASIGYLDIGGRFKLLKMESIDIKYPGSTIDAYIRDDGYVDSVTYTIKLDAYGKANAMGITGSANFGGDQVESWKINW